MQGRFARPSGAPTQHVYFRRLRPSQLVDGWRTRCRDEEEDLGDDEPGLSQRHRGAEKEEVGPSKATPACGLGRRQVSRALSCF